MNDKVVSMRSRLLIAAAVLAETVLLSGCGLTSSPADSLSFKAPKGWQAFPGIMGFMQFWKQPGADAVLMLFKSPKPIKTTDVFDNADLRDARIEEQKPVTICGNQPAQYFKAAGRSKTGHDSDIEMMMSNVSGQTYMAMYVYPVGTQADAGAEAALRELCTK